MKKKIALILSFAVLLGLLSGCMGTPVVICDHQDQTAPAPTVPAAGGEEAVKTGLAIVTKLTDSHAAAEDAEGEAKYDIITAAVTVDDAGVISACRIDNIPGSVTFSREGMLTSDPNAQVLTKQELGDEYGMKKYGNAKYEWYEQVDALAAYAVGKTVEELKNGTFREDGTVKDADLASTATIYLGDFLTAIEAAAANARHLGAQRGDTLRLASLSDLRSSKNAGEGENGLAQLSSTVAAVTMNGDTITSTLIDAVQAKVEFDGTGALVTDLTAPVLTKNQLGDNYGMKQWGGASFEWYEQAASFAAYVTGKTADQVAGIALTEDNHAQDADLAATVTISVGDFKGLILKAAR